MGTQIIKMQVRSDFSFLTSTHSVQSIYIRCRLLQVVDKLQSMYGDLYTHENVLISGIHTHSGPAGYFQYLLFEVSPDPPERFGVTD